MKLKELKKLIIKELKEYSYTKSSSLNEPGIAPSKPETTPKRRTLTPPKEAPKTRPKAENIINKITNRYKKLK